MQNKLRYNISGEKKVIKHIEVTTTNYTKTFIYCECKTITKWSDVSTDEWEEKEEYYIDKATGTKYILSGSTLSVISSSGTITINNFSNGQLGIHLSEKETIDKKNVERDVFLQEDFCSPLILDINNNGTSSTGLGNSQTYFDMDGDGFKERTAWVEQGDGLLVLDRNGNGSIDNGSELFGNFTPLSTGNSANDGFEALLQYDENHDGVIDHNDAVYNQLKVWMDDNANGITDTGELKTLQEAKVASVKLNPYEALLSFYDSNANNMIDTQDDVYDYILLRHDDNGGVTIFVPQTDNETAKKLFDSFKGHEILTTSEGTLLINGISFASLENIATEGDDILSGSAQNDRIIALGGNDTLDAGTNISANMDHTLIGEEAENVLIDHNGGDDILVGGSGNDHMEGGADFDTYIAGIGDTIKDDTDNQGRVIFNTIDLTGTKTKLENVEMYEDDEFVYEEAGETLLVTIKQGGGSLTIENWNITTKEALGIKLEKSKEIEVSVGDASDFEAAGMMRITVSLQRELKSDELLVVDLGYYTPIYRYEATGNIITVPAQPGYKTFDSYSGTWTVIPAQAAYTYPEQRTIVTGQQFNLVGTVTFDPGDQEKTYTYTWKDDDFLGVHTGRPNPLTLVPKTNETLSHYGDDIDVIAKQIGHGTIIDDDERGRYDPLVLDTNKDGFISTTPLIGSTTYFDITGDGLRERIGWISPEDALLAYDKNDNGQIDGISQADELHTLSELNITSINLTSTTSNNQNYTNQRRAA